MRYILVFLLSVFLFGGCAMFVGAEDGPFEGGDFDVVREPFVWGHYMSDCVGAHYYGRRDSSDYLAWCCCDPDGTDCEIDGYTRQMTYDGDSVRLYGKAGVPIYFASASNPVDCGTYGVGGVAPNWDADELQLVAIDANIDGPAQPDTGTASFIAVMEASGKASTLTAGRNIETNAYATWTSGNGRIYGNDEPNDLICTGNCYLEGDDGHDLLICGNGTCDIEAGAGNDYAYCDEDATPNSFNDCEVWGGPGHDVIHGSLGDSELHGEWDSDVLYGHSLSIFETTCNCGSGYDAEADCDHHSNCELHW
jgi:hypothetical protein